ncbi:unnamed protein product [Closterium sp. NIES-53]
MARRRWFCLPHKHQQPAEVDIDGFDLKLDLPALETLKLDCVARLLVSKSPLLTHLELDCLIRDLCLEGRMSPLASCVLPSLKSLSMSLDPFPFQGMRDLMTRAPGITSLNWFLDAELYPAWYRKDGPSTDEIARALGEIIKVCRSLKIVKVVFMDSSVRLFTIANCFLKLQKAFPCLDFSFYFDLVVDESESDPSGSDSEVESSSDSD